MNILKYYIEILIEREVLIIELGCYE